MIKIDADALFRAVTATGYKLLAYHLELATGKITSRTLRPEEIAAAPQGPSVKPLPAMGGDLSPKKDASPFGPLPEVPKKKLFDDDGPKKAAFDSEFWKRDEKKKGDLFGDGGFRRESGPKKLAEIFGDGPAKKKVDPFAKPGEPAPPSPAPAPVQAEEKNPPLPDNPAHPRIPAANEEQQIVWMDAFARGFGDPDIRDELLLALKAAKPFASWDKVLRKHQRMSQQWERYFRKQALAYGEAWLSTLGVQWELIENDARG